MTTSRGIVGVGVVLVALVAWYAVGGSDPGEESGAPAGGAAVGRSVGKPGRGAVGDGAPPPPKGTLDEPPAAALVPGSPPPDAVADAAYARGDRMMRQFEADTRSLDATFKEFPGARKALREIRAQLETDLHDIEDRFVAGDVPLQRSHEEMYAAVEAAKQAVMAIEGPAGQVARKAWAEKERPAAPGGADADLSGWGEPATEWGQ